MTKIQPAVNKENDPFINKIQIKKNVTNKKFLFKLDRNREIMHSK